MRPAILLAPALLSLACATTSRREAIARVALPLGAPWPSALPAAAVERLEREVADRRFISVGEGDHYVADKLAYRLALLRELATRRGARHLALELGASDAARVDAYLESGDERWLERVVLLGYVGESDRERRDLAFYTRLPEAQRRATVRFGDAEKSFYRSVRALSEELRVSGDRLHVFGFDLDATPGGGYEDARRLAESCAPGAAPAEVLAALTQPSGIGGLDEVHRLEALVARVDVLTRDLEAACGATKRRDLREAIDVLAASFRYFLERMEASGSDSPDALSRLRDIYDRREQRMEARFETFIATLPSDAPVILFLHNLHAARDSEAFLFGPPSGRERMWKNIGSRLESHHPGETYVVWLLYARGTRLDARVPEGAAKVAPRPGSLEAQLAPIPGPYVLFLGDVPAPSLFDAPVEFGTETAYGAGVLRNRVDALVFLPEAHAP